MHQQQRVLEQVPTFYALIMTWITLERWSIGLDELSSGEQTILERFEAGCGDPSFVDSAVQSTCAEDSVLLSISRKVGDLTAFIPFINH
jgi:hypothetical protein